MRVQLRMFWREGDMKIFKAISLVLAVTLTTLSGHTVSAQDFSKGWAAYETGDFATALKEWKPLAEQSARLAAQPAPLRNAGRADLQCRPDLANRLALIRTKQRPLHPAGLGASAKHR